MTAPWWSPPGAGKQPGVHARGNLQVATPLYAQVMLESRAGLRKYFRIEEINPPLPDGAPVPTEQGKTLLGMPEMPRPPEWPRSNGLPIFYDSVYRNDPVRVVAVVRDLYYQGMHRQVLVMVAESTGKRIEAEQRAAPGNPARCAHAGAGGAAGLVGRVLGARRCAGCAPTSAAAVRMT